jgi:hypothetical protein
MIVLKPTGGLCNRMRAINSALALAKQTGHRLHVIWEENKWLNCAYSRLFIPYPDFSVSSLRINLLYNTAFAGAYGFPRKQYHAWLNRFMFSKCYFDNCREDDTPPQSIQAAEIAAFSNRKKIYISTGHAFFPSGEDFKQFTPVKNLAGKIENLMNRFGNTPVGLHIRRTDHAEAIEQSTDEMFEQVMREELQQHAGTQFFLATDSPQSETHFQRLFGSAVHRAEAKTFGRNTPAAIEDAVVDLYLLSRCSKIYASFQSSFSETAAVIGKSLLHVVKKQTPEN